MNLKYEFVCKKCGLRRLKAMMYYRENSICGFCGHWIEFGVEAKRIKDIVGITNLITKVVIDG